MATRTSTATGNFSAGATWVGGVAPVDGDAFVIANTHVVTFDMDQSAWAGMAASTINAGGTLIASTSAGSYVLKMNANITVNGTFQAGTSTSTPYPTATTFTISFNAAQYISVAAAGKIYFYCAEPTIKYVKTTGAEAAGQTVLEVDTDVTGDSEWAAAKEIGIADVATGARDVEYRTIAGGGIAAGAITVTAGITNAKDSGSYIALVTRNIRVINSTYTSPVFIMNAATTGCYIGAEVRTPRAFSSGVANTYAGVIATTSTSITSGSRHTVNSVFIHPSNGMSSCDGFTVNGVILGNTIASSSSRAFTFSSSSLIGGCQYASSAGINCQYLGTINACQYGIYLDAGSIIYGLVTNSGTYGLWSGSGYTLAAATLNNTIDIYQAASGTSYDSTFAGATEFSDYTNASVRGKNAYFDSYNHDATTNSYKAWTSGGIVTSQTASPPTGYTIWYELAAEDTTQSYPVFRQYETVVLPGASLEVTGQMRIADGEDLSGAGLEPQLQLIDKFNDPLVDDTATPLDYDIPADVTGATTGWQTVDVIWANQGDAPRNVIVRMLAYNDGGVDTVYVDTAWAVAGYQDEIASMYTTGVNVKSISGDTTAADNLEAMYDGTGYIVDSAPASRDQIAALAGGVSVKQVAESSTVTNGTETNTYTATQVHDATDYIVTDDGGGQGIDFYLQFDIGTDGIPVEFHLHGYYDEGTGATNGLYIQAYNNILAAYQTIATIGNAVSEQTYDLGLVAVNVDSSGKVKIKFVQIAQEASSAMHINHCAVGYVTSPVTAAEMADAVWDETSTGHTDAGKAGAQLWTYITQIIDRLKRIGRYP